MMNRNRKNRFGVSRGKRLATSQEIDCATATVGPLSDYVPPDRVAFEAMIKTEAEVLLEKLLAMKAALGQVEALFENVRQLTLLRIRDEKTNAAIKTVSSEYFQLSAALEAVYLEHNNHLDAASLEAFHDQCWDRWFAAQLAEVEASGETFEDLVAYNFPRDDVASELPKVLPRDAS